VPDRILQKPGPLTSAELRVVRTHPVVGAQIVSRVDGLETIAEWIGHSHEHYDGSGYPDRLAADAIPEAARILLVADAFDAMTSDRVYRQALSYKEALEELQRNAGSQFDPRCVEAMSELVLTGIAVDNTAPRRGPRYKSHHVAAPNLPADRPVSSRPTRRAGR
jgi:HD-GYP domain-containing protein (c-di-GMP phosphodiesterase class II)